MPVSAGTQNKDKFVRTKSRLAARKKHWVIKPLDKRCEKLAGALRTSSLLAQTLINRDITDADTAKSFIRPRLKDLIEPELMPGIQPAVDRIINALKNKEKITIYGDYDVDGITGVAILWQALTLLGGNVDFYIPHRIDEGYGLNSEAIKSLASEGTNVLITVDCGITAFESSKLAGKLGMELIITDHHKPDKEIPDAVAAVHPALEEDYPNRESSGSMVAFKLAWAVANKFTTGLKLQPKLRNFMIDATSLAAMGTIADVMDLRGENRILTSYGLKSLSQSNLVGLSELIETAGLSGQGLDSYSIGFRLAPMLNAAGRMGHARLAVELLITSNRMRSMQIARYLKQQNDLRRKYEQKIFKQACELITKQGLNHPDKNIIVISNENWHSGVIGIVASRIVDKYYRPAIVINSSGNPAQGSARSIPGFDIFDAVNSCSKHLVGFGGHEMAAGVTIENEKIAEFAGDLEQYAGQNLATEDTVDKLHIDAVAPLGEFHKDMVSELGLLEPFGEGNPRPLFATKGLRLASPPRRVGMNGNHLQLAVTDNTASIRCIGFNMGKLEKKILESDFFSIAYQPQLNTYNGRTNVQLNLQDIQFE